MAAPFGQLGDEPRLAYREKRAAQRIAAHRRKTYKFGRKLSHAQQRSRRRTDELLDQPVRAWMRYDDCLKRKAQLQTARDVRREVLAAGGKLGKRTKRPDPKTSRGRPHPLPC